MTNPEYLARVLDKIKAACERGPKTLPAPIPVTVDTAAETFERETADAVSFEDRLEHERMEPTGHMFDNAPRESENEEDDDDASA